MVLIGIEWIAAIFAILGIIKILVVTVNKKAWLNSVTKPVYSSSLSSWFMGILALIVFYILLQTMTIVQIAAVMAFTTLLFGFAFTQHSKELLKLADSMIKSRIGVMIWIYTIFWLALMAWVLYEIFM